jgi:autotransporter-associated beta strand protein
MRSTKTPYKNQKSMKTNRRNAFLSTALGTLIFTHTAIHAQTYVWNGAVNNLANGAWGTASNWNPATVPNSATAIADLRKDWTGTGPTFALGGNRTLNGLYYTDTGASNDIVGSINAGSTLTFAGTDPFIETGNSITIASVVAGTDGVIKRGVNNLTLSGANTFSGVLTIGNGSVIASNNSALGTSTVSLVTGGATNPTRLFVSGGITISNPINVGPVFGVAGSNAPLQQTGTGQGRLTGLITITGGPSGGGNFVGGGAVGNELVLAGPIDSTIATLSVREGRVVFGGGGTGGSWTNLLVTNTALVGATDGIPTGVTVQLGASGSGALDLNGFDQSLAGLILGNTGNAFTGTVNLGAKTLSLSGNITTNSATTQNVTHLINATAGGALDLGASGRTLTLNDTLAVDDLAITGASIKGAGGLTKEGDGALALQNVTSEGPLTINAGTLAASRIANGTASTVTTGSLVFGANPTGLRMKLGPASDLITAGTLVTNGTTTITINQSGGLLPNGIHPLIAYSGTSPGLSGFALNPVGHAAATLIDTAGAISLQVTGNDSVIWDGTTTNNWVGANGDWKLSSNSAATDYADGDVVIFNDAPVSSDVILSSNVTPSSVTFNNTSATAYLLSGTGSIIGTTGLTKNGNGEVTIANPNAYSGPTTINAGSVIANFSTGAAIPAASDITIAAGSSLTLGHNGGAIALTNPFVVGSGTLTIDPNFNTAGNRDLNNVTWDASGFTGTMRLSSTVGTMRVQANTLTDIGTGPIEITNGGQLYINTANLTFPNNFTISGNGWTEGAGNLGAIRTSGTTNLTGTITVSGSGKIGALGGTAVVSNILTGGDLTFGGSINNASAETLAITGDASGLNSLTVNDGSATSSAASMTVNVGNGTNTGTLGTVPVTLKPDGFKNAVLRFDRTDGYTLGGAVTSAATTAANEIRGFLDFDCTGTGFEDDGLTITLGSASPAAGGRVRIGATRPNALATLTGTLTSEVIQLAGGQNNATLNIDSGANITANQLYAGDSANNSGTINQATGSTVDILGQVRVGHFGTNTSTYNLSGGSLTLSGASPNTSPSTAGGGNATTLGDNNLNLTNPTTIVGGGVYLGVDGTGIFNHTGGTLTTNWIVLDNRGDTVAGANMPDGIDRYNLSGIGTLLKLRSTYGLIARNSSTDVSFGGGTVQVDNGGTGAGTGADLNIPLDAAISTVASTTTTLDTNGATNAFTLTKDVNGSGTLALTGGGAINLSTAGFQTINAALTGSNPINKTGTGTTTLAGPMAGLTGTVTVDAGRLNVPASLNTTVTVNPGGILAGEISLPTLNLEGGTVLFDPNSAGSLAVNTLNLNVNSFLDVSGAPGVGTFTAFTYANKTGIGTLAVTNSSNFRTPPFVTDASNSVTVTYAAGKALTWTGTASGVWDINTAFNWSDGVNPETFFSGDSVTFPEAGANPAVTLTGLIAPAGVSVTSDTTNYTFTSTAGNLITGTTGLSKSGTSTLTLVGENTYSGNTTLSGGVLAITNANNIGNGVAGNGLVLSGGGKLSQVGNTAMNLGVNRSIAVGTGGAVIEHNNATAAAITIPGNLSGTGALAFQSAAAGGGNFILTGSNTAYTGDITVDSVSTGLTTLRIENPGAAPNASSITVNYPAAGANGNANTLTLFPDTVLPAATTINLSSAIASPAPPATISLRTQITTAGNATIDGPIKLAGDSIIQLSPSASATLTLNGDVGETVPGSFVENALQPFSNVLFLRGSTTSTIVVNGKIILPSAGSTVAITDGATAVLSSAGHDFKSASAAYGTIRIGVTNAIPTTARLVIGQGGNQTCTLDLNGFDQTVSGLEWQATSAATTKGISNTHPTNTSTFTINQLAAPAAANFSGTFTGSLNLVKEGPATTTLSTGLSTFTGSVTVNAGTLVASGIGANNGANSALGVANLAGRTVTVNTGGILSFTTNNVFGNGVGNADLPSVVINGGTLTSTRYNVLGNVALNGAALTQAATDGPGAYEGYQFLGSITVGGSAESTISATTGRANHLGAATQFIVADAASGADLTVAAGLKNPSADIGGIGSLSKSGPGTMVLGGINTYTGDTVVNGGTLELADNAQLRFVIGAASGTNNSLSGSGTVALEGDFAIDTTAAAALSAGSWLLENVTSLGGAYGGNFQVVNTDGSPWSNTGNTWTRDGGSGKTWTFDETTGTLTLSQSGYASWAAINAGGQDPNLDFDLDGVQNGVEFFMGETGSTFTANPAVVTSGAVRTVTWPKSASFNGTYRVETSENLASWTNVTGSVVDNGSSVVYTLPTGSPKVFVRLVVTPN